MEVRFSQAIELLLEAAALYSQYTSNAQSNLLEFSIFHTILPLYGVDPAYASAELFIISQMQET